MVSWDPPGAVPGDNGCCTLLQHRVGWVPSASVSVSPPTYPLAVAAVPFPFMGEDTESGRHSVTYSTVPAAESRACTFLLQHATPLHSLDSFSSWLQIFQKPISFVFTSHRGLRAKTYLSCLGWEPELPADRSVSCLLQNYAHGIPLGGGFRTGPSPPPCWIITIH